MKLKLPLVLLAALTGCMAYAEEYSYQDLESIPVYDKVTGSTENNYTVKVNGSNGSCWDVNAREVTWDSTYTYPQGHVLSVGSIVTEATVNIVTPTEAEERTVVTTGANLFIGGWGWGISPTDGLKELTGEVNVKDATLLVTPNSGGDSSCSQLNVGQAGSYKDYGCEGILNVDNGRVEAGAINVALSRNTKGTLTIDNQSTVLADRRGNHDVSWNYTGEFIVGYYSGSEGEVMVKGGSTLTAELDVYVGCGYDTSGLPGASGTITVTEGSTANLSPKLYVGYYNGSVGVITVDDSTLTAGTTFLGGSDDGGDGTGFYGTATLTVQNGATATLGDTYLGHYHKDATGTLTVDNGELTAGLTYVGSASGSGHFDVLNGGTARVSYMAVGDQDSVSVSGGATLDVAGNMDLEAGATLSITMSDFKVGGTITNYGTVEVDITEGGSFNVGSYKNYGSSTIRVKENTECSFGALELSGGSMTMEGGGTVTLGGGEDGAAHTTTFSVSGETQTTNIDVSGMVGGNFTVDESAAFTLDFSGMEGLSSMADGETKSFELHIIIGTEGFNMDEAALLTLLGKTEYNFTSDAAAVAMAYALETAAEEGIELEYKVQEGSDAYTVQAREATDGTPAGYDLVWTGTVEAYNANPAVPEPATATLSLLALAALAARRRRK